MSFTDETVRFEFGDSDKKEIGETLVDVYNVLEAKGYNPINQIVGYVLSGDPAYIPRHDDARNKIRRFDRDDIVEEVVADLNTGSVSPRPTKRKTDERKTVNRRNAKKRNRC